MILMASPETLFSTFLLFASAVEQQSKVGCLFVFNEPACYAEAGATAEQAFGYLRNVMGSLSFPPDAGAAADPVHIGRIVARCPVTGVSSAFGDFDCTLFCPQAGNADDPLHDPERTAPYTCVNASSDVLAFAHAVRDISHRIFGEDVYRLKDRARIEEVFAVARAGPLAGAPPALFDRWRAQLFS